MGKKMIIIEENLPRYDKKKASTKTLGRREKPTL